MSDCRVGSIIDRSILRVLKAMNKINYTQITVLFRWSIIFVSMLDLLI